MTLTFSEEMMTLGYSFNLLPVVSKAMEWTSSTTFVIQPLETLQANTLYTLTLNPIPSWQRFRSVSNIRVEDTVITFTTGL